LLIAVATGLLFAGAGPAIDPWVSLLLLPGAGMIAGILLVLLLGGLFPDRSVRRIERLAARASAWRPLSGGRGRRAVEALARTFVQAIRRLGRLRIRRASVLAALLGTQLLYFGVFAGIGVALAAALGAS